MAKKGTISHNSIKKSSGKKKPVSKNTDIYTESFTEPYYEYRHILTREIVAIDREKARDLAKGLQQCAAVNPFYRIETFHLRNGITAEAWKTMCDLFEELRDALVIAKNDIGDNRLRLGLEKKYDANLASYALHQYHPDWKAAEEYHDARKVKVAADSGGNPGNAEIHVHMDAIPSSGLVPDKKKEDNA